MGTYTILIQYLGVLTTEGHMEKNNQINMTLFPIMTVTVSHKSDCYIEGLLYRQKADTPAYSENTFV